MPIDLQPVVPPSPRRDLGLTFSREWDWLRNQDYNPDKAWTGTTATRRGTITGGPTFGQFLDTGDYRRYAIIPPARPLTEPILSGQQLGPHTRLGTVELDLVDPFSTIASLPDALGLQGPVADSLRNNDPLMFLASKNIDLFGMDQSGAPARLADYALAIPNLVIQRMLGQNPSTAQTVAASPELPYAFQRDPGYWGIVTHFSDDDLRQMARTVAARYIDPSRNSYLVDQLYKQFQVDKQRALAISSGNDAIDYRAIKRAAAEASGLPPALAGSGWQGLPFVGTQLAELANPISASERSYWNSLSVAERQRHLGDAGLIQMASDVIGSLPALSGLGTALAIAKGTPGIVGTAYRAYDLTLRSMNWVMATGLTVATANWALEAAWPEYSDFLGENIDRARPVSNSALMSAVNAAGFWSSGTWGGATAAQVGGRVVGAALGKLGIHPLGVAELAFFKYGMGGKVLRDELAGAGLSPQGLDLAAKRTFMSYLTNHIEAEARKPLEAAMRGLKTGLAELDDLTDFTAKAAHAQEMLSRYLADLPSITEGYTRLLALARKPRIINGADNARAVESLTRRMGRTLDHTLAGDYIHDYGAGFITRLTGAYTPEAMEAWARAKVTQLGGNGGQLGRHDTEGWAQIVRTLHNYEFDWWNGEVHAALNAPGPDGSPAGEAGKLALVQSDHLFADLHDQLSPVIHGTDTEAARAAVTRVLTETPEGRAWFAEQWHPRPGVAKLPENVPISVFSNWFDDIRPALPHRRPLPDPTSPLATAPLNSVHRRLAEEGTWTLAFKPVDEAGNFVSYVKTRSGIVFRSPWVEHALDNPTMVELGSRGWMASKLDSIFRGFRTWRLTEFQRGNLYRSLTSRFTFTPEQIERFHAGVLKLAREEHVQPQTTGTWPVLAPHGEKLASDIKRLGESIFGPGPYALKEGGVATVDWRREIASAYRQSFKLNLTAGLTSHLKYRLGGPGEAAALLSDVVYPLWRFNFSPVFKGGELMESFGLNALRGVNPQGDVVQEALFRHGGVGNDWGIISEEMAYDQLVQGTTGRLPTTNEQRFAASAAFYARRVPEDFRMATERAATQGPAQEFRAAHHGGTPILGTHPRAQGAQVSRIENVPPDFSLDPADVAPDYPELIDMTPEERGLWHATTNIDGVLHDGLLSRGELRSRRVTEEQIQAVEDLRTAADNANSAWMLARDSLPDTASRAERARVAALERDVIAASRAYEEARTALSGPEGLGGGLVDVGRNVSTTVLEQHAIEIADRLRLAARAARKETTVEEIVDHFTSATAARYPDDVPDLIARPLIDAGYIDARSTASWDAFMAELHTRFDQGGPDMHYLLVQTLDRGLADLNTEGFSGAVGLVAPWESMRLVDPEQVGIVRVAARKPVGARANPQWGPDGELILNTNGPMAGESTVARVGPDNYELQFRSQDLWVIDDRPTLPTIAYGDREELLRQLRATMAEEPTPLAQRANALHAELNDMIGENGIVPGLETRAQEIIDELDRLARADGADSGAVYRLADAPRDLRERFYAEHPEYRPTGAGFRAAETLTDRRIAERGASTSGAAAAPLDAGYLYHFTHEGYLDSIAGEGLTPRGPNQTIYPGGQWPSGGADPRVWWAEPAMMREVIDSRLQGQPFALLRVRRGTRGVGRVSGTPVSGLFSERTVPTSALEVYAGGQWRRFADWLTDYRAANAALPEEAAREAVAQARRRAPDLQTADEFLREQAFADWQRQPGAAARMSDVAGTPEALFESITGNARARAVEAGKPSWWHDAWETFWHPSAYKQRQVHLLQMKLMADEFPALLRASGNDNVAQVFRSLGIPENRWAEFLLEDRRLLDNWLNSRAEGDLQKLIDHAGPDVRGELDTLYASEDWSVITSLWGLNLKSTQEEAFGVHFFAPYRSAFERAINHPVLGIYPASWAIKAAREWARFLYQNRTFGELRLGMSPAVLLAQLTRQQNETFAQTNPDTLEHFLDKGPLGSNLFIFNLLMPGDWSSLPFPTSRSIRELWRGNYDPFAIFQSNLNFMGVSRDARLFQESIGEMRDLLFGPEPDPEKALKLWSIKGAEGAYGQPRR